MKNKKHISIRKFRTTDTFIEDAKKVHGDKYDYSEVVFTTLDKKSIDKMQTPLKCILPRSAWSSKRLRLSTLQYIATYTPMETYANIYYEGTNRGKTYTLTKGSYILFGSVSGWFVLC